EISKKTMYSETIILNLFNDWQKQGICTFKNTDNDTKIILNEIREDDITINRTIKYLKQNNSIKEKQFEAMMKYVITEDICKSQLLLNYFEEKSEPCGKCSVCKKRNKKPNESTDWDKIILKNIPFDGISIEQLADNLNINHTTLFPYLEQLQNNYEIVGVVTAVDKPAGRGQKINESAVKKYAIEKNLKVLQPTNLKSEEFLEELRLLNANLQVVVAFRMLPEVVWKMPKLGTF